MISGMVEVGLIVLGYNLNLSITKIVLLGLAYQLGNCVPNPINLNKRGIEILSIGGLLSIFTYILSEKYIFLFFSAICLAIVIQSIRSVQKGNVRTSIKRTFRIIGFMLSYLLNIWMIMAIYGILIYTVFKYSKNSEIAILKPKIRFINIIMIVHQIHDFSYCYFIILLIVDLLNNGRLYLIGLLFSLGWLTYSYIPEIIKGKKYEKYLIVGHIYLSIILIMLANAKGIWIVVFWVLTGFGSGTVYCISKIVEKDIGEGAKDDITFSENIGHILGIVIGLIGYVLFNGEILVPIYIAIIFAISTAILMIIYHTNVRFGGKGIENKKR